MTRRPWGVLLLTALSAGGTAWFLLAGAKASAAAGVTPASLLAAPAQAWTLLTYPFVHGNLVHVVFNLAAVWLFGYDVEQRWGTPLFLGFFAACAAASALFYVALWPGERHPLIGASGGAFGLIAAASRLFPDDSLSLYFVLPVRYARLGALFIAAEGLALLLDRGPAATRVAHLGGLACGLLLVTFVPRLRA